MRKIFADTSYFLAIINPSDRDYRIAHQITAGHPGQLVTTAWILVELGSALCRADLRPLFLTLLDKIKGRPENVVVPPNEGLLEDGIELFRRRHDKNWSLTDCISFVVMEELGITDALTNDTHFQQAGFNALLLK